MQGRIRGTYGINAKPVAVETPADSPPAPGVTRASLRPKPTAKASPDDEEVEMVKPAAGARHLRAVSSGPDAGAAHDSPGSPMHIKASAPEGQYQNSNLCDHFLSAYIGITLYIPVGSYSSFCQRVIVAICGEGKCLEQQSHRALVLFIAVRSFLA